MSAAPSGAGPGPTCTANIPNTVSARARSTPTSRAIGEPPSVAVADSGAGVGGGGAIFALSISVTRPTSPSRGAVGHPTGFGRCPAGRPPPPPPYGGGRSAVHERPWSPTRSPGRRGAGTHPASAYTTLMYVLP